MNENPNYRNRQKRQKNYEARKKMVLVTLLASLSINVGGLALKGVDALKDEIIYNAETWQHFKILDKNEIMTDNKENLFIKTDTLAEDIKELPVENELDFYHHLIGVARNIRWNINQNFDNLLDDLNLNKLDQKNSDYPSEQEFRSFLERYGLIKEDGTIDFERWEEYDKKTTLLEREFEKESKSK